MVALLIEGFKEQQNTIKKLESKISNMETSMKNKVNEIKKELDTHEDAIMLVNNNLCFLVSNNKNIYYSNSIKDTYYSNSTKISNKFSSASNNFKNVESNKISKSKNENRQIYCV